MQAQTNAQFIRQLHTFQNRVNNARRAIAVYMDSVRLHDTDPEALKKLHEYPYKYPKANRFTDIIKNFEDIMTQIRTLESELSVAEAYKESH